VYSILVGKPVGERPLGGSELCWEDNSRTVLSDIGLEDVDWIHLAQDMDQWRVL
jgi:hypothetical protein